MIPVNPRARFSAQLADTGLQQMPSLLRQLSAVDTIAATFNESGLKARSGAHGMANIATILGVPELSECGDLTQSCRDDGGNRNGIRIPKTICVFRFFVSFFPQKLIQDVCQILFAFAIR